MVEVHVEGRIALGQLAEFTVGVRRYIDYLRQHDYVVPRVLHGLSGQMNTVRLVYTYPDLNGYERHEANSLADTEYAKAASGMPFVDGTITYSVFNVVEVDIP
jgi:hypothetical protein